MVLSGCILFKLSPFIIRDGVSFESDTLMFYMLVWGMYICCVYRGGFVMGSRIGCQFIMIIIRMDSV